MPPEPSTEQPAFPAHRGDKPAWAKTARELRRETAARQPRRRLWPWGIVGLLTLALAAVIAMPDPAPPAAPADAVPANTATLLHPLDVITIQPQTLRRTLPVSGTLHPHMQVEIASRTTGMTEQVGARLGERVSQGDLLMQIESDGLRAQLHQQKAALEANRAQSILAEAQKQRSERLSARGLTAAAELENSRSNLMVQAANLEMQRAAVSVAEITLRDTRILAPFDGIIAARKVDPGQTVTSGAVVFELVDLSSMLATMDVPVARTVALSPGQTVHLTSPGLPGREFIGRVEGISPVASEGSRNSAITVRVDNPDRLLRGGMFVDGQIATGSIPDAISIPRGALREDADGHHVLRISDGKLIRQPVEFDPSMWDNALIVVTSGLTGSDRILSGQLPELREGMQVRIEEPR